MMFFRCSLPLSILRLICSFLGGVFVVLLCGLAFAVLIAIFEFCYNSRRNAPAERVSLIRIYFIFSTPPHPAYFPCLFQNRNNLLLFYHPFLLHEISNLMTDRRWIFSSILNTCLCMIFIEKPLIFSNHW